MAAPFRRQLSIAFVLLAAACDGGSAESGSVRATSDVGFAIATALNWTPDSALLVGVFEMTGGGDVWAPDCDVSGLFRLESEGALQIIERDGEICSVLGSGNLAVSRSGLFIAFRSTDNREIRIFERKRRRSRSLVHPCADELVGPTWTSRGDTLVVISRCTEADSVLLFDARGRLRRGHRLPDHVGKIAGFALSDDAAWIAVYSVSSGMPSLSVFRLGSGQGVTVEGAGVFPAWQPGGDLLAATVAHPGGAELVFSKVMDGASPLHAHISKHLTVRLSDPHVLPPLLWSQDGSKLVFSVGAAILSFEVSSQQLDTIVVLARIAHDTSASGEASSR